MAYGAILGQTPEIPDPAPPTAAQVSYSNASTSDIIGSNNVQGALDNLATYSRNLFTSVSNGKNQIASAITDKGVSASGSESFASLAGKIGQLMPFSKLIFLENRNITENNIEQRIINESTIINNLNIQPKQGDCIFGWPAENFVFTTAVVLPTFTICSNIINNQWRAFYGDSSASYQFRNYPFCSITGLGTWNIYYAVR